MSDKIERAIDSFEPGQLVVLRFPGMMDSNHTVYPLTEESKAKIKEEIESAPQIPAVVLSKRYIDDWPVYDVGFWTRLRSGDTSGMLLLKDLCVWRYMAESNGIPEGQPPEWFVSSLVDHPTFFDGDYPVTKFDCFWLDKDGTKQYPNFTSTEDEDEGGIDCDCKGHCGSNACGHKDPTPEESIEVFVNTLVNKTAEAIETGKNILSSMESIIKDFSAKVKK